MQITASLVRLIVYFFSFTIRHTDGIGDGGYDTQNDHQQGHKYRNVNIEIFHEHFQSDEYQYNGNPLLEVAEFVYGAFQQEKERA